MERVVGEERLMRQTKQMRPECIVRLWPWNGEAGGSADASKEEGGTS